MVIVKKNRQGLFFATLPYKFGIITAVSAGVISIPLLFHLDTVLLFNEYFVTTGMSLSYWLLLRNVPNLIITTVLQMFLRRKISKPHWK